MEKQDLMHLKNKLLIATPKLQDDPLFSNALIYLYEHSVDKGSSGIMVNKATNLSLSDVVERLEITCSEAIFDKLKDVSIIVGGPMARKNALILRKEIVNRSNQKGVVGQYLENLTESILQELIDKEQIFDFEIVLGFTSWGCGLLEQEIIRGFWVLHDVDQKILFEVKHEDRYNMAVKDFGIDFSFFIQKDGHG